MIGHGQRSGYEGEDARPTKKHSEYFANRERILKTIKRMEAEIESLNELVNG
ncbi:MAG: hypothetical protein HWN51_03885, partial [Desulfobacterales bacterium]|nr:hypothetical protein [Desulfobacterales bacterium]